VTLKEEKTGKNVAGSRTYDRGTKFLLNPDKYVVTVRPIGVHKDKASQTFTIAIKQGETIVKKLDFKP